jgi:V/A-type H+-transporting ATPase subunit E
LALEISLRSIASTVCPTSVSFLDIIGGAVVESSDGALRYDLTYETLAREVFNNRMKEVSRILFG